MKRFWIPVEYILPQISNAPDYLCKVEVKRKLGEFETEKDRICFGYLMNDGRWINDAGNKIYVTHWRPL
jgi:hypothetical protein